MKSPGFTAVTILSLAIGIGANTSIFSAINAVLLRPLPFKDPDRLMNVDRTNPSLAGPVSPWSYPKFEALRANNEVFEVGRGHELPELSAHRDRCSRKGCKSRWCRPAISPFWRRGFCGRTFAPEEDQTPGTHPVIVIGHGLWERRFG